MNDTQTLSGGSRTATQATVVEQPERPTILDDIESTGAALTSLADRVQALAGRMAPLLAEPTPQPTEDAKGTGPTTRCGLSNSIHAQREHVCAIEDAVRELLSRLELP